jgi:hypothetical protein
MKRNRFFSRCFSAALLAVGMSSLTTAQAVTPDTPLLPHLMMDAAFVRESVDQVWHVRIAGVLPTPPGLYLIVYNERGDIVSHHAVPAGSYPAEAPFVLTVSADGVAQQYVIKILGSYQNCFGITLPMTDLPFEVYGGKGGGMYWVMPYPTRGELRRLAFQVNPGAGPVSFDGADQVIRVLDSTGAVIADNREATTPPTASKNASRVPLNLKATPGQTYWLDPGNCSQFGLAKGSATIFFAFTPEKWFYPSITWSLESRPWYEGLFKE